MIIWGDVAFENSIVEDLVLMKSDGYPTYHLANVVDDHDDADFPCYPRRGIYVQHAAVISCLRSDGL